MWVVVGHVRHHPSVVLCLAISFQGSDCASYAGSCRRQNSFPSGSASTTQGTSGPWPMSMCVAPSAQKAGHFGLLVRSLWPQVEVQPVLGGLHAESGHEGDRRSATSRRAQFRGALVAARWRPRQDLGPEPGESFGVAAVDHDLGPNRSQWGSPRIMVSVRRMTDVPAALTGLLVVDLTTGVAGGYAGKLLADFGAEVVLVEPPGGSALRVRPPLTEGGASAWFTHLGGAKASCLPGDPDHARVLLRELCACADAMLVDGTSPWELPSPRPAHLDRGAAQPVRAHRSVRRLARQRPRHLGVGRLPALLRGPRPRAGVVARRPGRVARRCARRVRPARRAPRTAAQRLGAGGRGQRDRIRRWSPTPGWCRAGRRADRCSAGCRAT